MQADNSYGKAVRMSRILASGRPTLMVPLDDALIFGPTGEFRDTAALLDLLDSCRVDSILSFAGTLHQLDAASSVGRILNITASTVRKDHTHKVLVNSIRRAVALGADAVAVHINLSSTFEGDMLRTLGTVIESANVSGLPVVAIAYPRREAASGDDNYLDLRTNHIDQYTDLVAHTCRVAYELGADVIKTQFTGTAETFSRVIDCCRPVPILMAGGALLDPPDIFGTVTQAIEAGAAGVSLGRNIHQRPFGSKLLLTTLAAFFRGELTVERSLANLHNLTEPGEQT